MKAECLQRAIGIMALTAALGVVGACSPDPATEIVVRIDSNMGPELIAVQVVLDRGAGSSPILSRTFPIGAMSAGPDGGAFALPGTIAVVPSGTGNQGVVRALVTAVTADATHTFTTNVSTMFVSQRTLELDVFLPARCEDAAARSCGAGETCGISGCVPSTEPPMMYDPDAGRPDGGPAIDVPPPVDGAMDVGQDVATADTADVPAVDVGPTPLPPPRQIAPLSTTTVSTQRPTFHWTASGTSSAAVEIQLCTDRVCSASSTTMTVTSATGTSVAPTTSLAPGSWFWRIRSTGCGSVTCAWGPMWHFVVGHTSTATHDTSFGSMPDVNGDGRADLVVGAPQQLGGAHGTMVGAVFVFPGPALGSSFAFSRPVAAMSNFGQSVVTVGDLNGDGFGDFVVVSDDAAFVYFGPIDATTSATLQWAVPAAHVAAAGDVNGDGYADVLVGLGGVAEIFYGAVSPSITPTPITPPAGASSNFGSAVAGAGDLNGDGFSEVIVADATAHRVHVFPGAAAALSNVPVAVLTASDAPSFASGAVAGGGDMDGDGLPDVAVGDPEGTMPRLYVYRGTSTGYVAAASPAIGHDLSGQPSGYGAVLAMGGDVDGDGRGELAVGLPGLSHGGSLMGSALVVHLAPGGVVNATNLPPGGTLTVAYGSTVALADYDNDGYTDAAAADPSIAQSGSNKIYAFRGAAAGIASTPFITVRPPAGDNDDFGRSIAAWAPRWLPTHDRGSWVVAIR